MDAHTLIGSNGSPALSVFVCRKLSHRSSLPDGQAADPAPFGAILGRAETAADDQLPNAVSTVDDWTFPQGK